MFRASSEFWPLTDFPWKAPTTQSNFCRLNARQEQGRKSIHQISLTWKWKWSTGGKSFSLSSVSQGSSPYLQPRNLTFSQSCFLFHSLRSNWCTNTKWMHTLETFCSIPAVKKLAREIFSSYLTICLRSNLFTATNPISATKVSQSKCGICSQLCPVCRTINWHLKGVASLFGPWALSTCVVARAGWDIGEPAWITYCCVSWYHGGQWYGVVSYDVVWHGRVWIQGRPLHN